MKEQFVPKSLANQIKDLGFSEACIGIYQKTDIKITDDVKAHYYYEDSAPLWSQAFRWFETNHRLFVDRRTICSVNEVMSIDYYIHSIGGTWQVEFPADYSEFDEYKANTRCLEKLIQIITKSL